tara:strand:- start:1074 stop:1448 length:375 start_codon:yes stop_codon:yes gene_type:complete
MRHLALACILLTGCGTKIILRDTNVYKAELDQYHKWATAQAEYLRGFIEEHCECESDAEGPQFADPECENAADFVLTIEARAEWHRQMSLWNAGLIPEGSEPADTPPAIEPLSCPLPAALSDEE